jgi:hypothetical protein
MRFPVDIATTQLREGTRQTVSFFQTPSGDLCALRGHEWTVRSDFEELMPILLHDGPCEFRIPTELTLTSNPSGKLTGIVRLLIAVQRDKFDNCNTFTIHSEAEHDGQPVCAADPITDSNLASAIEKSLASMARLRKVIPQRCFFCRFSDYEPHTSVGNLKCYLDESAAYCDAAAKMESNTDTRYLIFRLRGDAVEDFGTCAAFEVRPLNWGYRG